MFNRLKQILFFKVCTSPNLLWYSVREQTRYKIPSSFFSQYCCFRYRVYKFPSYTFEICFRGGLTSPIHATKSELLSLHLNIRHRFSRPCLSYASHSLRYPSVIFKLSFFTLIAILFISGAALHLFTLKWVVLRYNISPDEAFRCFHMIIKSY